MSAAPQAWQAQVMPDRELAPAQRRALGAFRARVFGEGLAWREETDGQDAYDACDPMHVMVHDDGCILGYLRLLPTDGPCMLHEHFAHLLTGDLHCRRPDTWEVSRFAALGRQTHHHSQLACLETARLLVRAALAHARERRAGRLVGVATAPLLAALLPLLRQQSAPASMRITAADARGVAAFALDLRPQAPCHEGVPT